MDRQPFSSEQSHHLTPSQKTGFVFLLIFSVLVAAVGFLQMRNTIYNPFAASSTKEARDIRSLVDNETLRLQNTDTDLDGIVDYEELTFYETSPYLPDTDSDGIGDKQELDQGTNPLCAKGQVCETQDTAISEQNTSPQLIGTDVQSDIGNPLDALNAFSGEGASSPETDLSSYLSSEDKEATIQGLREMIREPKELRTFLIQTGQVTQEQLQGISDVELTRIATELFEAQFGAAFSEPSQTDGSSNAL